MILGNSSANVFSRTLVQDPLKIVLQVPSRILSEVSLKISSGNSCRFLCFPWDFKSFKSYSELNQDLHQGFLLDFLGDLLGLSSEVLTLMAKVLQKLSITILQNIVEKKSTFHGISSNLLSKYFRIFRVITSETFRRFWGWEIFEEE